MANLRRLGVVHANSSGHLLLHIPSEPHGFANVLKQNSDQESPPINQPTGPPNCAIPHNDVLPNTLCATPHPWKEACTPEAGSQAAYNVWQTHPLVRTDWRPHSCEKAWHSPAETEGLAL